MCVLVKTTLAMVQRYGNICISINLFEKMEGRLQNLSRESSRLVPVLRYYAISVIVAYTTRETKAQPQCGGSSAD